MDNEDEDDFIVEQRTAALEVRANGTNGRRLEGYAATFNTEARIGDFTESIAPGAFQLSGAGRLSRDIVALVDHDVSRVLARTGRTRCDLPKIARASAFDLDVPRTNYGDDVLELVDRGDIGGMSFGFVVPKNGETWDGGKRTLIAIDLREISVVCRHWAHCLFEARSSMRGAKLVAMPASSGAVSQTSRRAVISPQPLPAAYLETLALKHGHHRSHVRD